MCSCATSTLPIGAMDQRRIEVIAEGLRVFHGAQLAIDVAPTLGRSKDSLHPKASASSCPAVLVPLGAPSCPVLGHSRLPCWVLYGDLGADGDAPSVSDV